MTSLIEQLDRGLVRAAECLSGQWHAHLAAKQAILDYFNQQNMDVIPHHPLSFDKIPLKFTHWQSADYLKAQLRVVPGAIVRYGSFLGPQVVLMPCFVNIGAYVGAGSMIDTHATVGSCAQIGERCHISGGVGIGGVLEPEQACPTIIEDDCFIGAHSEITEGVVVRRGAVIAMGVYLSASTKIYNALDDSISYGEIPANSVVVPGSLPKANSRAHVNCAVIIKQVDDKTRSKTAINDLLRTH